jgi:hypothetical protein
MPGRFIKPLTRNDASVLVVDHLAKNADSRNFGPTGTAAKMRAADGRWRPISGVNLA